ncbi:oxygen-insensitive NADPH nitroreductase [Listeria sp. PSOL-1]|uniref:oxygen-insensitive NADPH nitroreductase n=1 Tax=Listeria sp. PSOL-1 TaxID=1844999 RepID=UPI0013D1A258|nr:oxygen-insensitive NADPH nitroreductase [Listeria sp. PSOL-1]
MNSTVEQILSHYSVRAFQNKKLTQDEIRLLVQAAQSASTSNFMQAYSIIGVSDQEKLNVIAEISGSASYVAQTGHFFVFVADLARNKEIAEVKNVDFTSLETTEKWLVAVIDATLAAQNMAIAAESMGLGICFIGGIRNNLRQVSELLEIPDYALPIFGLTIGHPAQNSAPKPRMPEELIYHENVYQKKDKSLYNEYDATIRAYYEKRTGGKRIENWTDQMARGTSHPTRLDIKSLLTEKNLAKK